MTAVDYVLAGIVVLCGINAAGVLLLASARAYYDRKARRADLREPLYDPPRHFEARATPIRLRDHT